MNEEKGLGLPNPKRADYKNIYYRYREKEIIETEKRKSATECKIEN